jgi:hypothetical protein
VATDYREGVDGSQSTEDNAYRQAVDQRAEMSGLVVA